MSLGPLLFRAVIYVVVVWPSAEVVSAVPLVSGGESWRYRKGSSAPQADWKTVADAGLDGTWLTGAGGFGYGDGDDATLLPDMQDGYRTVAVRKAFTIAAGALAAGDRVQLQVDYDDGYVAYLDGVEVARSANAPGAAGQEPAHDATATSTREASGGGSGAQPAEVRDLGAVADLLPPGGHVLAVIGMNESVGSSDFSLKVDLATVVPPPPLHWALADSPISLSSTFPVPAGQVLTIEAGVEVRCPAGVAALDVAGSVVASGTAAAPIRFVPSGSTWGRVVCRGPVESSFTHCVFDRASLSGVIQGTNSRVRLESCSFPGVTVQLVDLTGTSCHIRDCIFPSITGNELIHFSGMPSGGFAVIENCQFGTPGLPATSGYNDVIDFTGGNRPGPVVRFYNNVFLSGVDDCFDMDGTDAHIEGNVFLNVRKDAARASSSNPITSGADGGNISELVIVRNFFYNCEHALLLKNGGSAVLQNNTILRLTDNPVSANTGEDPGLILFGEPWRGDPYGAGAVMEGTVASDFPSTAPWPLFDSSGAFLIVRHSLLQGASQPGAGNLSSDPLFVDTTGIDHTNIRTKLALQASSPARGTGPNGIDMGAAVPAGATLSGEPASPTAATTATLTVAGPGIWAFRWRLDGGVWSAEVPVVPASVAGGGPFTAAMLDTPGTIALSGLGAGAHVVEVQGKNSAGDWQVTPTVSRTWTVVVPSVDSDGDGMTDDWEEQFGFDPGDPADALPDADGDGASNRDEFLSGTHPREAGSVLRLTATGSPDGTVVLTFSAVAGRTYAVQLSESLAAGDWEELQAITATEDGPREVVDAQAASRFRAFYRVVTPAP